MSIRRAKFRVVARLDRSRFDEGTVVIDRTGDAVFAVRPKRRRREYALPLSVVASLVVERVIRGEILTKKKAKAEERKKKQAARRAERFLNRQRDTR